MKEGPLFQTVRPSRLSSYVFDLKDIHNLIEIAPFVLPPFCGKVVGHWIPFSTTVPLNFIYADSLPEFCAAPCFQVTGIFHQHVDFSFVPLKCTVGGCTCTGGQLSFLEHQRNEICIPVIGN